VFLFGSAAVLAAPHAAEAQQVTAMHRIGFLTLNPATPGTATVTLDAFRQGLKDLGYTEGQNHAGVSVRRRST
jgi:hypothetical protein